MPRQISDGFIKEFCEFCSDTEVPSLFALWAGVSCVSIALGRSCYMPFGHSQQFANLYTVLVAGSAKCRKSTAVSMAEDIVHAIDPPVNILSQKMSPESLIHNLRGCPDEVNGTVLTEICEGHMLVDELSTLIDQKAFQSGMIPLLTTLWDSKDIFEYSTRSRGKETIRNAYVTLFGASTIAWIKEAVPITAIGGGFTSRVLFVYQESPEKMIAFPEMTEENVRRKRRLMNDLNHIARLSGRFQLTDAAKMHYSKEYEDFRTNSPLMSDKNTDGYGGRRHMMLLKLGMILSASERDTLIVSERDISRGIQILEMVEKNLPKVMQAITSETVGDVCEEILGFIRAKRMVRRSELVAKFRHRLSSKDLQVVLDTLTEMRVVVVEALDGDFTYVYRGK